MEKRVCSTQIRELSLKMVVKAVEFEKQTWKSVFPFNHQENIKKLNCKQPVFKKGSTGVLLLLLRNFEKFSGEMSVFTLFPWDIGIETAVFPTLPSGIVRLLKMDL